MGIAKDASDRLGHPIIDQHIGSYLLGCDSPDIRIITKGKRQETHFVQLDFKVAGEGIKGLFESNPDLAISASLNDQTRAFILGYASHLLADELWITEMYRPYFGNRDIFPDKLRGDLMDRALQLELDRQTQKSLGGLKVLSPLVVDAEFGVDVGFITTDSLNEWRHWVEGALSWDFTWDRLRNMTRRVNSEGDSESAERISRMVDAFLSSVTEGLDSIYSVVPKQKIHDFREHSIEELLKFGRGYIT